ncbi:TadA family conjugal transfer-associated ATPase [Nakamurella deserti]|uniref:TadA family conjugal transfer-associated ATPase n=1 Tax=Nakamurella deserti TaxID=2164074 RepID=UPI0014792426
MPAGTGRTDRPVPAVSADLVARVQQRLTDHDGGGTQPSAAAVAAAVRAEAGVLVSDAQMLRLIRALQAELVGVGPLAGLLADPATTDVVVNGPDDVRVDRGHGWEPTGVRFTDDEAVQRLARRLAAAAGRRLDDARPFVDAQLVDGTRLHAVLPPIAADGTSLSLRVLRPAEFDLAELGRRGAFPPVVGDLLRRVVAARLAVLISGGTGTGKTTLLAALLGEVGADERLITVEDAGELRPRHPHVVRLIARTSNVEGAGEIELRNLVRQGLRMRPDRLIVGEVRGAEVVDLLIALNTGHRGGAGTVHANTAADVPARLSALAALGGMSDTALHAQLAGAVQVVIQLERLSAGGRVVRRIAELGVLRTGAEGRVHVVPAHGPDGARGPGAAVLDELLRSAP